jgi:hypothetical protein
MKNQQAKLEIHLPEPTQPLFFANVFPQQKKEKRKGGVFELSTSVSLALALLRLRPQ